VSTATTAVSVLVSATAYVLLQRRAAARVVQRSTLEGGLLQQKCCTVATLGVNALNTVRGSSNSAAKLVVAAAAVGVTNLGQDTQGSSIITTVDVFVELGVLIGSGSMKCHRSDQSNGMSRIQILLVSPCTRVYAKFVP
jgi:hypothetical protein